MTLKVDLKGKKALVTGASSEGFGKYFSKILSASGADIVVAARREAALSKLVDEVTSTGGSAKAAALDVTNQSQVTAIINAHGPFDIIVNNAGVAVSKAIFEQTEKDFDIVMDTNLKGTWNVALEAAKSMKDNNISGSIVNIASVTGIRQMASITPYATSKSAVIQLTKQLAIEFVKYGIRVNAIAPGYFDSDMTDGFFDTEDGKALIKRIPMRKLGNYESLGAVLLLLCSDASSYMTGTVIPVDGGHSISSL